MRRVLLGLEATGVQRVLLMPDYFDIGGKALHGLHLSLQVDFLDMLAEDSEADSARAAALMREAAVDAFTPILNPPQVAILGVGRIVEKPVRHDRELAWRQVMTLSLTVDHRVLDGAPAAEFLQDICKRLEDPTTLEA